MSCRCMIDEMIVSHGKGVFTPLPTDTFVATLGAFRLFVCPRCEHSDRSHSLCDVLSAQGDMRDRQN